MHKIRKKFSKLQIVNDRYLLMINFRINYISLVYEKEETEVNLLKRYQSPLLLKSRCEETR